MLIKSNNINCPKCNTALAVINHNSEIFVCGNCNNIFQKEGLSLKVKIQSNPENKKFCHSLNIGEKINYKNIEYTLTGKLVKHEAADTKGIWAEYCFSSEGHPSIFLSESFGHWNITEQAFDILDSLSGNIRHGLNYKNQYLKRYHQYIIKLDYAEGEFDVDVLDDVGSTVVEFVNAPTTLIIERTKAGKKNCYVSTYLFHEQVEQLIKRKFDRLDRIGVSGGQPFYFNLNFESFTNVGILLILFFLAFNLIFGSLYPPADIVINKGIGFGAMDSNSTVVIEEVDIPYDNCIMSVTLDCNTLNNDWVGADIDMISATTGDHHYSYIETSKYSGYDDEGAWQSGSNSNDGNIQNIEKGKYSIEITSLNTRGNDNVIKSAFLSIKVYKGSWYVSLLLAGIVIVVMAILYFLKNQFESRKWEIDDDDE